jgi:hypothetical protein
MIHSNLQIHIIFIIDIPIIGSILFIQTKILFEQKSIFKYI